MNLRNALLAGLLALACGPGAVMWATAETAAPAPAWVVDPAVPGDNLPPAKPLTPEQVSLVRAWIDQGAK